MERFWQQKEKAQNEMMEVLTKWWNGENNFKNLNLKSSWVGSLFPTKGKVLRNILSNVFSSRHYLSTRYNVTRNRLMCVLDALQKVFDNIKNSKHTPTRGHTSHCTGGNADVKSRDASFQVQYLDSLPP